MLLGMATICPTCQDSLGIREAIYGMPEYPIDKGKYFVAGCTSSGQKFVCIKCGWGIEEDDFELD